VDAVELLLGDGPFIADTSAWWRLSSLPAELAELARQAMGDDRLWITPIVRMEILYSARSTSEYTEVETELDGFRILRNDRAVADAAIGELAEQGAWWETLLGTEPSRKRLAPVMPLLPPRGSID